MRLEKGLEFHPMAPLVVDLFAVRTEKELGEFDELGNGGKRCTRRRSRHGWGSGSGFGLPGQPGPEFHLEFDLSQGPMNGWDEVADLVLVNVSCGAGFEYLDHHRLIVGAGNKDEWNLPMLLAHEVKRGKAVEGGQTMVRENYIGRILLENPHKILPRFHPLAPEINAPFPQMMDYPKSIGWIVLHYENVESFFHASSWIRLHLN